MTEPGITDVHRTHDPSLDVTSPKRQREQAHSQAMFDGPDDGVVGPEFEDDLRAEEPSRELRLQRLPRGRPGFADDERLRAQLLKTYRLAPAPRVMAGDDHDERVDADRLDDGIPMLNRGRDDADVILAHAESFDDVLSVPDVKLALYFF